MYIVLLTNSKKVCIVDFNTFKKIKSDNIRLYAHFNKKGKLEAIYTNKNCTIGQYILGKKKGFVVDHKDGNPCNNLIDNLRFATFSQNCINRRTKNRFGFKGVKKTRYKYTAEIGFKGTYHYLGSYKTPKEAALAYDSKALELYGEFALLNFPNKLTNNYVK